MIWLASTVYIAILFFFGWQFSRYILCENRIERLCALSGILGVGLYSFFINIAGHFFIIQETFYWVLILFLLISLTCLVLWHLNKTHEKPTIWELNPKWRMVLFFAAIFIFFSVLWISFNHPMDLAAVRVPTAVTIAGGNFPPVEIFNPSNTLNYHYAPDLLAAATHKVTGMPIYLAYNVQNAVLSATLFLVIFFLAELFVQNSRIAFLSSVTAFYAGSLIFLKGLAGIPVLYAKYVTGENASFKFVSDAIFGEYSAPAINSIISLHWGAMAFSLMAAAIYLYFHALKQDESVRRMASLGTCGLLLAFLALTAEPYFAALLFAIGIYPFIILFAKLNMDVRRVSASSAIVILISLPVALLQGGLLPTALMQALHISGSAGTAILYTQPEAGQDLVKIGSPFTLHDGKRVYGKEFITEWILLLGLLVPALAAMIKRRLPSAIFFLGLFLPLFFVPLIVDSDFQVHARHLGRFFYPLFLFGGLIAGIFLATAYQNSQRPFLKKALGMLFILLIAQGIWTHSVWLLFGYPPKGEVNPNSKFFAEAGTVEAFSYTWVKTNTDIGDTFLIVKDSYPGCVPSSVPNCSFILNTGRMAPIFILEGNAELETSAPEKAALFNKIKEDCANDIVWKLGYRYLYVDNEWPAGMEEKCLASNDLDLVFEKKDDSKFVRIYKTRDKLLTDAP